MKVQPSPQPPVLYVAFSGETGDKINVLKALSAHDGSALGDVFAPSPNFRELRNMVLDPANHLYVINAYKGNSCLYKFGPAQEGGITRPFLGTVVTASEMPGLLHPYSIQAPLLIVFISAAKIRILL